MGFILMDDYEMPDYDCDGNPLTEGQRALIKRMLEWGKKLKKERAKPD